MGYGFFTDSDLKKLKTAKIADSECGICGLYKQCKTPKMPVVGQGQKKIMIIAEAPGEMEDARGIQLVGECAELLRRSLFKADIDLDEDCLKTNSVCCRPENNQAPSDIQITSCRPRVFKDIKAFQPNVLILLGSIAVKSVLAELRNKAAGSISTWRGYNIPDQTLKCWICPTFHPSYVLREQKNKAVELIFNQDIAKAMSFVGVPVPDYSDLLNRVSILSEKEAMLFLNKIYKEPPKICAFDYETTGIKPHKTGHKVVSMSICYSEQMSYSFMVTPALRPYIRRFLADDRIGKVASNMAFEESWSRVFFETPVSNFIWDTMIDAHILDNRPSITSIKFQTYIRYGIADYNSAVEKYLNSGDDKKDGCANDFNRINECPELMLLKYDGLDSLFEYMTAIDQMKEMLDVPNFI
jgi:DNA polymerase